VAFNPQGVFVIVSLSVIVRFARHILVE